RHGYGSRAAFAANADSFRRRRSLRRTDAATERHEYGKQPTRHADWHHRIDHRRIVGIRRAAELPRSHLGSAQAQHIGWAVAHGAGSISISRLGHRRRLLADGLATREYRACGVGCLDRLVPRGVADRAAGHWLVAEPP